MPILFNCTLVCDADGCENTQDAVATLRSDAVLGFTGLMGMFGGQTPTPFDLRYDRTSGLEWKAWGGETACCPVCHGKVEERQRMREVARKKSEQEKNA